MKKQQLIKLSAAMVMLASSNIAMAHLNIAQENAYSLGNNGREYLEGKSAFINVNLPHDCSNADGNHYDTTDVVVILPNTPGALSTNFITTDNSGGIYTANALMGTKTRISRNWRRVKVVKGPIDSYYSHGVNTEDTRAVKWLRGEVDNDHYENHEIRTSFPKIDPASCIGTLRVEIPAIQYCRRGYVTAWIGTTGSIRFPADGPKLRLEETYVPYINVVRDVENNPYPSSCPTDASGNVIPVVESVRPSDADIDLYGDRKL